MKISVFSYRPRSGREGLRNINKKGFLYCGTGWGNGSLADTYFWSIILAAILWKTCKQYLHKVNLEGALVKSLDVLVCFLLTLSMLMLRKHSVDWKLNYFFQIIRCYSQINMETIRWKQISILKVFTRNLLCYWILSKIWKF